MRQEPESAWESPDSAALESIYDLTCRMVASLAPSHRIPPQDVKDLTHDAFYRIVMSLKRFDPERGGAKLSTWMYIHARSTLQTHNRTKLRRPKSHQSLGESNPEWERTDDVTPDPYHAAAEKEVRDEVDDCVESLDERRRTRYRTRFPRGGLPKGGAEAARLLGISPDTMKDSIHEAVERIERCMERKGFELFRSPRESGGGGNRA